MGTTDKYDLVEIEYSHTGWNGDMTTNTQIIDAQLHTRVLVTLGEAVSKGDPLFQDVDGNWYKAIADGVHQPARGLALEDGDASEQIRMVRRGPLQKDGWRFKVPYKLWLAGGTGGLTHHKPADEIQCMGWAIAADTIFLEIENMNSVGPDFFGTTTTMSTTSSTTSSSSTSSTASTVSTTSSSSTTTTTA